MNDSFEDWLAKQPLDGGATVEAARYYLAERTDDMGRDDMRAQLQAVTGAPALEAELSRMAKDATRLEAASHTLLVWAWEDPAERPRVERAVAAARQKLPVIEVGLLAMVAVYGMYLVATNGQKRKTTRHTGADGQETVVETEYYPHPLSSLVDLLRGK